MEMINEMNNKFFGLKEKKTKNNNLIIFFVFTVLLSITFFLLYLSGSLHCFVHNFLMVFCLLLFKHVIRKYSRAKAQDSPCSLCRPG